MVSITLEGLWMVSDRIVDFQFFIKFHRSRTCNNFQFLNYHGACYLCIKKAPNQVKIYHDLIKMVTITLEGLWMFSDRIVDFQFVIKFHRSGPAIIFKFLNYHGACYLCIKKAPNQAKICQDLIKIVTITLEGLWMFSDRIVDFQFFIKFHRSGPTIIFSF